MHILKYNLDHKSNIKNFKKDLYICLSSQLDNDIKISKYTDDFVLFFNKIYNVVSNFENDFKDLLYEYEFNIEYYNDFPIILLNGIKLLQNNNIKIISTNNLIKKIDYQNIIKILDFNYIFEINTNPYIIVKIVRSKEYIQCSDFYKGKNIYLFNSETSKEIEINFDNKYVYIYDSNQTNNYCDGIESKSEPEPEPESEPEPYAFIFYNKKLIIHGGPSYNLIESNIPNTIYLDEELYHIHPESTVEIYDYL